MIRREFTVGNRYNSTYESPVRWLLSHVLRNPWLLISSAIGYIGANALLSVAAVLLGAAFDVIVAPVPNKGLLLSLAITVLLVRIGRGLLSLGSNLAIETLAQRVERDTREELCISLLGKSQTFHNRQRTGDIMARATNDVQQIKTMINPGASLIFDSGLSVVVPLVAIGLLQPALLLIPLIFALSCGIALYRYNNQMHPVMRAQRMQFGNINARLAETVTGIEVVKAYGQEAHEQQQFMDSAVQYRALAVQQGRLQARYLPVLLYSVAVALTFGHALLLFRSGMLSIGQIITHMGLMAQLRYPTTISLYSFSLVQLGIAGAQRILALLQAETELDENTGGVAQAVQGSIVFEQVAFGYDQQPVLKEISFRINPGETIAIVGQTGAGKTTLTRLINRIYDVSAGSIFIDGIDIRDWNLQSLRSQISMIEQDIFLFSRTIRDNIAFGMIGTATQDQIEQAARAAQIHDFIMSLPDGYETLVGERGMTLSGGQRQRIAMARALLSQSAILVLDDSTSAVDSATEDQIQQAIRHIQQGRTLILITHRLSQIRWADRILVLRGGELIAQGTHEELLEHNPLYRRMFGYPSQKSTVDLSLTYDHELDARELLVANA